jgi:hypothetical protein
MLLGNALFTAGVNPAMQRDPADETVSQALKQSAVSDATDSTTN